MVKKKKNETTGGFVILAANFLGAIILLASFLAAFVLIGIWFHFERAIKRYPGVFSQNDIQLSSEELQMLNECLETKERIQLRIAAIENQKHTLLVRKNGEFDSRSKEGRALNIELEVLRSDLSACNVTITRLELWEHLTYGEWVTNKSGLFASRIAVFSLPVSITTFCFFQPASVLSLSNLIEHQVGLIYPGQIEGLYGALTFGAWTSMALFLLLWAFSWMVAPKFERT